MNTSKVINTFPTIECFQEQGFSWASRIQFIRPLIWGHVLLQEPFNTPLGHQIELFIIRQGTILPFSLMLSYIWIHKISLLKQHLLEPLDQHSYLRTKNQQLLDTSFLSKNAEKKHTKGMFQIWMKDNHMWHLRDWTSMERTGIAMDVLDRNQWLLIMQDL